MQKVLEFLRHNKEVAFATVEDNKPKIRVFQIMKISETTLYFATSPHKEVYKQLQNNPNVELLGMSGNISVRIMGSVVFDVPQSVCIEIFDTNEVLPRLYPAYKSLVYFCLHIREADYYDLTPNPPLFKHYEQ